MQTQLKQIMRQGRAITAPHLRDLLELSSFAATTVLLVVGVITLLFTAAQIREAANTRIATIYLQITDMWDADKAVASRMWLTGLDDAFSDPAHHDLIKDPIH